MADLFLDVEKEASEYNELLLEQWSEALERSSNTLGDDKAIAENLGSPEVFLRFLEEEQRKTNSAWLKKTRTQIIPYIKALNSFFLLFLALLAAPPSSASSTMAWGVFFFSIQLCLQSEERCQNMLNIHKSVRQTLLKINRFSSQLGNGLEQNEEFKEALVDIYVVLVEFWVEAIKQLQESEHLCHVDADRHLKGIVKDPKTWKTIKTKLGTTLDTVEERYRMMKELADDQGAQNTGMTGMSLPSRPAAAEWHEKPVEPKTPIFVLSIPENTQFQGRNDILGRIHSQLNPASRSARLCCFTIYGMGGVGKTQTAAAYAYNYGNRKDHASDYEAVLWINSENEESLRSSLSDIAFALKLNGVTSTTGPDRVRREIQNWLSDTDYKWLLVFDNVDRWDTITGCWPPGTSQGSIIITSRDWSLANKPASAGEELTKLDPLASRTLFLTLLDEFDAKDAEAERSLVQILELLDGLPLAIQQIASLINSYQITLMRFVAMYKENRSRLHQERGSSSSAFYKDTLHSVWRFPSGETQANDKLLRHLLGVLSLLASDNIAQDLLEQSIKLQDDPPEYGMIYGDELFLRSLLAKLRSTAMIRQSGKMISIHRLTQAAYIDFVDVELRNEMFTAASLLVSKAFPQQHRGDPLLPQWKACADMAPHVRSLVEHWQEFNEEQGTFETPLRFVKLLCNAAWYLREIGDFEGSLLFVDIGIKAAEPHTEVSQEWALAKAHLLNTRGVVLWNQYNYTQSREALETALHIRSEQLNSDDIELIGTKANLASLVAAEGNYEDAQRLYKEAEDDHNRSPETPAAKRLASCRYAATQGRLHTELKNFFEADKELQRSLSILKSGDDNALYRRAIDYCFGNLRLAENKLEEARKHYQSCLDDFSKDVTDKDQIRSCGCYYKLGHIALMRREGLEAKAQLDKASDLAAQIESMGWQGRIATLQARLLQDMPEVVSQQGNSAEQLQRRADALRAALASLSGEEEGLGKEFHIYTPWQTR